MHLEKYKSVKTLAVFIALSFVFVGCGEEESFSTTVSIDKKGQITNTVYEDFEQDYYDISELSDMASSEISSYNSECLSEKVFLKSLDAVNDDNSVKMVITFNSVSDYVNFNKTMLFYGTVQDALDRGYSVSTSLINSDGETLGDDGISRCLSNHIIITSDKSDFITPFNVEYYTKGVELNGKKEAVLSEVSADEVQLLLSK